jgi:hypothetical protein
MANKDYSKVSGKYIKIRAVYQKALSEFIDNEGKKGRIRKPSPSLRLIGKRIERC